MTTTTWGMKKMANRENRAREYFERFASVGSILFGIFCGVAYAFMIYNGKALDARIALAVMFLSAGVMGVTYFAIIAKGRRTLPLLAEMLKLFFVLWFLVGLTFFIRVFSGDTIPGDTWAAVAIYFLVGMIAGVVWSYALVLIIGLRQSIAAWEVVRFPVWVKEEAIWIWNIIIRLVSR